MKRLLRLFLSLIVLVALILPIAQTTPAKASNQLTLFSTASDASMYNVGANYTVEKTAVSGNTSTTANFTVGQSLIIGQYYTYRSYIYFDTSSIPDLAVITSATLKLYGASDLSGTDFDIMVQTNNNTYPHDPLLLADYDETLYGDNLSSLNTASFNTTGYNNFALNAAGIASINMTGATKWILRSSRDINSNTPGALGERVIIYNSNQPGTSQDPKLEITYSLTTQIIKTNDASDILPTSATLQGELLSTENQSFVSVYFQYGSTISYGIDTIVQNFITTGTFNQNITSLQYNQTYHFRAVAKINGIYFYGQDFYFTTLPAIGSSTDLRIISVAVFSNYLQSGDLLFTAEVINTYTGYYPNADPKKYFTIQLLDTNNTDILGATPLQSWGDRPISIYVNATNVAANFTELSHYYIKMIGTLVPSTPAIERQLVTGDWYGYDFSGALDDWVKGTAINMELSDGRSDYLTNLTDQGLVVTDAAGGYFTMGIPGITQVRPNLFSTSTRTPDIVAGVANNVWDKPDNDLVAGWRSYLSTNATNLTYGIPGDITKFVAPLGISGKDAMMWVIFAIILLIVVGVVKATGGQGGLVAILLSLPILWLGVWFRIVPGIVWLAIIIILAYFFVRQFFIKTT